MNFNFRDREKLIQQINEWNSSRLDLFELSMPNDRLEFHGVMRFFFQGNLDRKYQTKCVRVSSAATTRQLMYLLIEKFHPDMRNVRVADYSLYEHHSNGERRLADNEHPLLVQLRWGSDAREGKFVLKNEIAVNPPPAKMNGVNNEKSGRESTLKRLWGSSKRRRKRRSQQQQQPSTADGSLSAPETVNGGEKTGRARTSSTGVSPERQALPDSSFTRTISNPEEVMRRKRQQKLERKLKLLNDGSTRGGTLRVYGETLNQDVPYKTLLLTTRDTAAAVVRETLEKYGLEAENPAEYCLVKVMIPPRSELRPSSMRNDEVEEVLADDDCPLEISANSRSLRGSLLFQIRHRPPEVAGGMSTIDRRSAVAVLVEMMSDGRQPRPGGRQFTVSLQGGEVRLGSAVNAEVSPQNVHIPHRQAGPLHCFIIRDRSSGKVVVRPVDNAFPVWVNERRISGSTPLENGSLLRLGADLVYRYAIRANAQPNSVAPPPEPQQNQRTLSRAQPQQSGISTLSPPSTPSSSLPVVSPSSLEPELLPAWLVPGGAQIMDRLMDSLINRAHPNQMSFRLAPAYLLYLLTRASLHEAKSQQVSIGMREQRITMQVNRISGRVYRVARSCHESMLLSTFWMANTAELLHFIKYDQELKGTTLEAQDILAEAVQQAFNNLFNGFQFNLAQLMDSFLDRADTDYSEDHRADDSPLQTPAGRPRGPQYPPLRQLLQTLSTAMHHLRQCCANAALTIQLFSQLFHYMNQWLFNRLVTQPHLGLCSREWGFRLDRRLNRVKAWAERQGLELAADCHLQRVSQACQLLTADKSELEGLYNQSVDLVRLNSIQLRAILQSYLPSPGEPSIPGQWIDFVVSGASQVADKLLEEEQCPIQLEEEIDLDLPLLLPDDGYSCDIPVRGIPPGLGQYAMGLERSGLARLVPNQKASGLWTVHMYPYENAIDLDDPLIRSSASSLLEARNLLTAGRQPATAPSNTQLPPSHTLFVRKSAGSLGLSIVTAKGAGQSSSGVFVKAVVIGGSAAQDGRLAMGDQLLEVDGTPLAGVSQEEAARLIQRTGEVVRLTVVKDAARWLGILHLIQQSPDGQARNSMPLDALENSLPGRQRFNAAPATSHSAPNAARVRSPEMFPPRHQIQVAGHQRRPESVTATAQPVISRVQSPPYQTLSGQPIYRQSTGNPPPVPPYPKRLVGQSKPPSNPQQPPAGRPATHGRNYVNMEVPVRPDVAVQQFQTAGQAGRRRLPPAPSEQNGKLGGGWNTGPRNALPRSGTMPAVDRLGREQLKDESPEEEEIRAQKGRLQQTSSRSMGDMAMASLDPWLREEREEAAKERARLTLQRRMDDLSHRRQSQLNPSEQAELERIRVHTEFEKRLRESEITVADEGDAESENEFDPSDGIHNSAKSRLATLQRLLQDMDDRKKIRQEEDRRMREKQEEDDRKADERLRERLEMFQQEKEEEKMRQRERLLIRQRQQEESKRKHQNFLEEQSRIEAERELEIMRLEHHQQSQRRVLEQRRRSDHDVTSSPLPNHSQPRSNMNGYAEQHFAHPNGEEDTGVVGGQEFYPDLRRPARSNVPSQEGRESMSFRQKLSMFGSQEQ